jgi:hypothetical protein
MSQHPHIGILTEALKDTSRQLECRHPSYQGGDWCYVDIQNAVKYSPEWEFRFADTKPECVSPLTQMELIEILSDAFQESGYQSSVHQLNAAQIVANAAHRAAIKQVAELPAVTSLGNEELHQVFKLQNIIESTNDRLQRVANAAIAEFQRTLLKQLGE